MIDENHDLSIRQQCTLLSVNRGSVYFKPKSRDDDTDIANHIVDIYRQYPMFGYRRVHQHLKRQGVDVNHKRVQRLMKELNLRAIYPGPKTTVRSAQHKKFSYLLRDISIVQPHQAWQVDITYLRTHNGFMYLFGIIDVYSRKLLSWRLSNTLETAPCLMALDDAIHLYGCPEIINSDQGVQFTSTDWIEKLQNHNIKISMCGVGRSNDNAYIERFWRTLKYEGFHIHGWRSVDEIHTGVRQLINWYNNDRPHQSLAYKSPNEFLAEFQSLCGYVHKSDKEKLDLTYAHIAQKQQTQKQIILE